MKKIFALMLAGSIALTGCDLFGSDDEGSSAVAASETKAATGVVNNISGAEPGAFDLLKAETVSASEDADTKDVMDVTYMSGDFYEDFQMKLTSGNDASFLEDLGVDYSADAGAHAQVLVDRMMEIYNATSSLTEESTEEEWMAAYASIADKVPTDETSVLEEGDVVHVLLGEERGEYSVAVLSITSVVADEEGKNNGKIEFEYKVLEIDKSTLPAELTQEDSSEDEM